MTTLAELTRKVREKITQPNLIRTILTDQDLEIWFDEGKGDIQNMESLKIEPNSDSKFVADYFGICPYGPFQTFLSPRNSQLIQGSKILNQIRERIQGKKFEQYSPRTNNFYTQIASERTDPQNYEEAERAALTIIDIFNIRGTNP